MFYGFTVLFEYANSDTVYKIWIHHQSIICCHLDVKSFGVEFLQLFFVCADWRVQEAAFPRQRGGATWREWRAVRGQLSSHPATQWPDSTSILPVTLTSCVHTKTAAFTESIKGKSFVRTELLPFQEDLQNNSTKEQQELWTKEELCCILWHVTVC